MEKMFTLENHSFRGYIYNYMEGDRVIKTYEWKPMRGKLIDKKTMPESHYLNFLQISNDVKNGRFVIAETETKEDALEQFDTTEYEKNAITKDRAIEMLNGNVKDLKKALSEITNKETIRFIADLAKEEKIDSVSKQKAIAEALNKSVEVLFAE